AVAAVVLAAMMRKTAGVEAPQGAPTH
ncbi:MAG: hypothetical protein K0Q84_2027, partial [Arthrobacter sp.]|nr:hypothetical protein [Arthrobacter sp.]